MRVCSLIIPVVLLASCDSRPSERPGQAEIAGTWTLDSTSLHNAGAVNDLKPKLELRTDGSFEVQAFPSLFFTDNPEDGRGLHGDGSWRIVLEEGAWVLEMRWKKFCGEARDVYLKGFVCGRGPPFRLQFVFGDPDSNEKVYLKKRSE